MKRLFISMLSALIFFMDIASAQHHEHSKDGNRKPVNVEPQPLLAHALRISEALTFAGSALSENDQQKLKKLQQQKPSADIITQVQDILDPYCLAVVDINPEARVKVDRGMAQPKLTQSGWTIFLVKVLNDAGVTSQLVPESPNAILPYHPTSNEPRVLPNDVIPVGESANRYLDLQMFTGRPLKANLSGLKLE